MPDTQLILRAYHFGADYSDLLKRWAIAESVGLEPRGQNSSDDRQFGVDFVYCGSHLRAHSTGWCTVGIGDKLPLHAHTQDEADAESRALGLLLYGDGWQCTSCAKTIGMQYRDELCGVVKNDYRTAHTFARPTNF